MWLYVPLVVLALAQLIYWFFTRTFNYFKDRNIKYRKPVPLFGNIKEFSLKKNYIGNIFRDIYEEFPNEKVVGCFRMTTPAYVIRDPDIIKLIMIKDFDKFADRGVEFSKEGLGQNLFHADGDTWRVLRNKLSPIFTSGKLKNMFHLIVNCGDKFIDYIEETQQTKTEINFLQIARKFTMSSIAACAFGIDIDYKNPGMDILEEFDKNILENPYHTAEIDFMFPGILKLLNASLFPANIRNFFYDLVQTVCAQRNNKPGTRNDFMDLILEIKQQKIVHSNKTVDHSQVSLELTESIIAAQAFVFYVAGFETSSSTSSFLMFELMKNPEIQNKVIAEIDATLLKNDGKITYEAISDMSYLSMVFDETLRKYPIIDPLFRIALEDYKIPGTNITIPKGKTVLIPAQGIHHDEKYYPNPEKFIPERFTPENSSKLHSGCYLPFGIGPRNCIGMRFGKVQTKYLVAKLLSNYRLEPVRKLPERAPISPKKSIMGSDDGVPLKLIPRR